MEQPVVSAINANPQQPMPKLIGSITIEVFDVGNGQQSIAIKAEPNSPAMQTVDILLEASQGVIRKLASMQQPERKPEIAVARALPDLSPRMLRQRGR